MDISELTRAKLANNQQSSLLKLVLWSNLLNNTQEQETRDNQKTQAEHDWFEHIMDQPVLLVVVVYLLAIPPTPQEETPHSSIVWSAVSLGILMGQVTDKEEEDEHLPSLVHLKPDINFQSASFIISATSTYDRHAVHIKYLIGQTSSSVLHYPIDLPHHHHHESLIDDDHYQFYCNPLLRNHHQYYPNVDDCTLITGKIPSNHHPQFRVTQLDILLDYHLKPPSLNTHSDTHYKELLSDAVDPDCCPVINHHHQLLFWKIFVLH
ncbi:hypothetical protein PSTT_14991 [Puccinia striiformis]|uniref:Uncharacterized protein n=1 Tax=Puccinia striiformis TaxID=27350 RepID=A0A2S4UJS8_9BASI|nr:hypothetical protein PSTT_14991 [Puccinia striiformis]